MEAEDGGSNESDEHPCLKTACARGAVREEMRHQGAGEAGLGADTIPGRSGDVRRLSGDMVRKVSDAKTAIMDTKESLATLAE